MAPKWLEWLEPLVHTASIEPFETKVFNLQTRLLRCRTKPTREKTDSMSGPPSIVPAIIVVAVSDHEPQLPRLRSEDHALRLVMGIGR
jgi:hypothetical protein